MIAGARWLWKVEDQNSLFKRCTPMRWTITAVATFLVLIGAYFIWPLLGLHKIADAIEAKDAAALGRLVDFHGLRKSLTTQIISTYLKVSGQEEKLGNFGKGIAMSYGRSIATPIVDRLVNEQTLLELLTKGKVAAGRSEIALPAAPFGSANLRDGWQIWNATEYGLGDFYVYLPPSKPPSERLRIKLSLIDWEWKLSGIDLPEALRVKLTNEFLKEGKVED